MELMQRLSQLVMAEVFLTVLVTQEEERAFKLLRAALQSADAKCGADWKLISWNIASGWNDEAGAGDSRLPPNPREALKRIEQRDESAPTVYVLKDVTFLLRNDPAFVRGLRNLTVSVSAARKRVVLLQVAPFLPPELNECAVIEPLPLPGRADFLRELSKNARIAPDIAAALAEAMQGLTLARAMQALRCALAACRQYDRAAVECVMAEKKQLLAQSEALSYMDAAFSMDSVGGLARFKKWLADEKVAFSDYGKQHGLPPPRGVLLAGIPGTGKSLAAKAAASVLGLPLIKLDISRIFHSYVGESESMCARTLQLLSALAPCACYCDEIDKVFAQSASTDSGTTQRVLGQILNYMQDQADGIFFVATCNHVERLPPELIRKGRFAEEIFFVDLPSANEREEILGIHIGKYLQKIGHKPLSAGVFAGMMEGFTGAEIEQVVKKALMSALNEHRPVNPSDLSQAIDAAIPQSRSMSESITEMRILVAEGRYQSAG